MDQHTFVRWAQENYEQRLMDPTSDRFEDAHYPLNRKKGNEVIPLHRLDHAIQGVWQSEEEGCVCFFAGDTKQALNDGSYWPLGLMDAWDLYDKWTGRSGPGAGGRTWWHQPETGERRLFAEDPGAPWEKGMGLDKIQWWHHPKTGKRIKAVETPGREWLPGQGRGPNRGWKWWHKPDTGQAELFLENPGEGWVKGTGRSSARWWINRKSGVTALAKERPGPEWSLGRGRLPPRSKDAPSATT